MGCCALALSTVAVLTLNLQIVWFICAAKSRRCLVVDFQAPGGSTVIAFVAIPIKHVLSYSFRDWASRQGELWVHRTA